MHGSIWSTSLKYWFQTLTLLIKQTVPPARLNCSDCLFMSPIQAILFCSPLVTAHLEWSRWTENRTPNESNLTCSTLCTWYLAVQFESKVPRPLFQVSVNKLEFRFWTTSPEYKSSLNLIWTVAYETNRN